MLGGGRQLAFVNPCPGNRIEARFCGEGLELEGHFADELRIEMLTNIWENAEGSSLTPLAWYDTLIAEDRSTTELDKAIRRSLAGDNCRAVRGTKDNDF